MGPRHDHVSVARAVAYVGAAVAVATYALLTWNDRLDQAAMGEYAWPADPGTFVAMSLAWATTVTLWCAVAAVTMPRLSRGRRPWALPLTAVVLVGTWALVAWWRTRTTWWMGGWGVPWPGPAPALTFAHDPTDAYAEPLLLVRPGVAMPVVLCGALLLTCWTAHRVARASSEPSAPLTPGGARLMAYAVLGPPILAAAAAGIALQASSDDYVTALERVVSALVDPGVRLVLAVAAALLLAGTGRTGWVVLGVVQLWAAGPLVLHWWSGGPDVALLTAALSTLATAMAAAVGPATRAIARLDALPGRRPADGSVPDGADAQRARV